MFNAEVSDSACNHHTDNESDRVKELFATKHFNRLSIAREGETTVYHAILSTERDHKE